MITLHLDWREVLWWLEGGMAGSHIRWSVYEDMVNRVWTECSEQERRNIFMIMRRDLGHYWRPDGWNGYKDMDATDEGDWKPESEIHDQTPWMYFRQVLARFNPDNQYAVTMPVHNADELYNALRFTPAESIISCPSVPKTVAKYNAWQSDTATVTVRAYRWQNDYRITWSRRCDKERIIKTEKLVIPDNGTM